MADRADGQKKPDDQDRAAELHKIKRGSNTRVFSPARHLEGAAELRGLDRGAGLEGHRTSVPSWRPWRRDGTAGQPRS